MIPSGTYQASKDLGGILFSSSLSRESAQVLIRYLQEVKGMAVAPEEVAAKLADEIPGATKENILKVLNQHGAFAMTSMLLSLLLWYVGPRSKTSASVDRPVPALVQPATTQPTAHKRRHAKPRPEPADRKLKPDQWCSCRSGKKAKNCHPERCD